MVLDFEYGVNTGNRFLQFVDHDEEPEDFIAAQTKEEEEKQKSLPKDLKQSTKKVTTKTTTSTTATTKTNKENLNTKTTNVDQRRQQSATAVFTDNNNQQTRGDSARGARGGARRGGPPQEGGAARGGRSQRFNKFEGKGSSTTNESTSFEQGGEPWSSETGGRGGRGRGGPRRGNFEGGRGTGGRGRGGRGNFNNRNEEGSQENNGWQQSSESNFDNTRSQSNRDFDQEVSPTERPFEPDNTRRTGGRGNYRGGRPHRHGDAEGGQEDYRANRRQFDRQPRSFVTGVKPIEKKDGEGAHNWGNPTENPEEHPISDEITETTPQSAAPVSKDWAQQVDEAEKQMTLDEYKKKLEEKRRAQQEKLPQFKTRIAGEGEDPKSWQKFEHEYRKKNDGEESGEEEEEEEGSGDEENESVEELEEEQLSGKKKLITIPLRFKPIELPRGSANSRFGQRRGGGNRFRPNRDEQQRSTSPNQGQQSPSSQQYDDQSSYRGGPRGGGQRRSNRGSRQGRSNADPNAPALDNPDDFPTLPKQ